MCESESIRDIIIEDYPKVLDNGIEYILCSEFQQCEEKDRTSFLGYQNILHDCGPARIVIKDGVEFLHIGKRKGRALSEDPVVIDSTFNIQLVKSNKVIDWRKKILH